MTVEKLRASFEQHIRRLAAILTILVVGVWAISALSSTVRTWVVKNSVFNVIILVILAEVLVRLVELNADSGGRVRVHPDEPHAVPELRAFIETNRAKQADLIEYSTATIHELLHSLRATGCGVRLLICHPDAAVTPFQRDRILDRIRDLRSLTFRDYQTAEIRMYRLPASIRGRLVDNDYVTVGWHTYTSDETGLVGHTNPMVSGTCASEEGRALRLLFQAAFEKLWNAGDTVVLLDSGARWAGEASYLSGRRRSSPRPRAGQAGGGAGAPNE